MGLKIPTFFCDKENKKQPLKENPLLARQRNT